MGFKKKGREIPVYCPNDTCIEFGKRNAKRVCSACGCKKFFVCPFGCKLTGPMIHFWIHMKEKHGVDDAMEKEQDLLNVAAYHFVKIDDSKKYRDMLKDAFNERFRDNEALKGYVILSEEGINLFVTGSSDTIDQLKDVLNNIDVRFKDIDYKVMPSTRHNFSRLRIRRKQEIVSFRDPEFKLLKPDAHAHLEVDELRQWYKDHKDFMILDVRSDFECNIGKFKESVDLQLKQFCEFPETFEKSEYNQKKFKDKTWLCVCTGGIKTEKAARYMKEKLGFKDVRLLSGGILKYILNVPNADEDFKGELFVFDDRVTIDPKNPTKETKTKVCQNCMQLVTEDEIKLDTFIPPLACPNCYKPSSLHFTSFLQSSSG